MWQSVMLMFFVVAGTTKSPWIKTAFAPISLNIQLVTSQFSDALSNLTAVYDMFSKRQSVKLMSDDSEI